MERGQDLDSGATRRESSSRKGKMVQTPGVRTNLFLSSVFSSSPSSRRECWSQSPGLTWDVPPTNAAVMFCQQAPVGRVPDSGLSLPFYLCWTLWSPVCPRAWPCPLLSGGSVCAASRRRAWSLLKKQNNEWKQKGLQSCAEDSCGFNLYFGGGGDCHWEGSMCLNLVT